MVPRFDPHAVAPPGGSWDFVVDAAPPRLAPTGSPRLLLPGHSVLRLVPDIEYRQWRNEAIMLAEEENLLGVLQLKVRGAVTVGWYAAGADILDFDATIVDPEGECEIALFAPSEHRKAVMRKVTKALDWYRSERIRREQGCPRTSTAYEFWMDTRVVPRDS